MATVKRLTLELQSDFFMFMDGPAFESQPKWLGCYCQQYLNSAAENETATSESNRKCAAERIQNGTMNGYLAYLDSPDGTEVVGWLSANAHDNYRFLPPVGSDKIATIICISVQKRLHGQGIATKMLDFAIQDLRAQGFQMVQAAPLVSDEFHDWGYRGKLSMYQKAGFDLGQSIDDKHVLVTRKLG